MLGRCRCVLSVSAFFSVLNWKSISCEALHFQDPATTSTNHSKCMRQTREGAANTISSGHFISIHSHGTCICRAFERLCVLWKIIFDQILKSYAVVVVSYSFIFFFFFLLFGLLRTKNSHICKWFVCVMESAIAMNEMEKKRNTRHTHPTIC